MDDTSAPLLERLKRGDETAWRQFRRDYLAFIERQVGRMLRDGAAIDEISHDVFVVLSQKLPEFQRRGSGSFRAYLRSVTRLQCLAWLKRERGGAQAHGSGDSDVMQLLAEWDDPRSELSRIWDQEHEELWSSRLLKEAELRCGETGPRDVAVFTALHEKQLDREEIARQYGLSPSFTYKIDHRINRILSEIRQDWADLLDLDES